MVSDPLLRSMPVIGVWVDIPSFPSSACSQHGDDGGGDAQDTGQPNSYYSRFIKHPLVYTACAGYMRGECGTRLLERLFLPQAPRANPAPPRYLSELRQESPVKSDRWFLFVLVYRNSSNNTYNKFFEVTMTSSSSGGLKDGDSRRLEDKVCA